MMKKGFLLIEVLVAIVTLPVALLLVSRVFVALVRDVPKDVRLLQQNTEVLAMTWRIADDMDRAKGLPRSAGAFSNNARTLLIQLPEAVACYQQSDDGVTRTLVGQDEAGDIWQVPDATVAWRCREQDGRAYAVELQTHLERRLGDRSTERFPNSYVYFIDGLAKAEEVK